MTIPLGLVVKKPVGPDTGLSELTPESWTSTFGGFSMSKHRTAFKQYVVKFYLRGDESYRSAGAPYGIDHSRRSAPLAVARDHWRSAVEVAPAGRQETSAGSA